MSTQNLSKLLFKPLTREMGHKWDKKNIAESIYISFGDHNVNNLIKTNIYT